MQIETLCAGLEGDIAIADGERGVSYGELRSWARSLANWVESRAPRDGAVGVYGEVSAECLGAMLGVIGSGRLCVPLDSSLSALSMSRVVEESRASLVISCSDVSAGHANLFQESAVGVVSVESLSIGRSAAEWRFEGSSGRGAVAYFTSGSTGAPKGCVHSLTSLASYVVSLADAWDLNSDDRVMQFESFSSATCAEEALSTFAAGATFVVRAGVRLLPPGRLLDVIAQSEVSVVNLPTVVWRSLVATVFDAGGVIPHEVKLVVVGGSPLDGDTVAKWRAVSGGCRLVNTFGATEVGVALQGDVDVSKAYPSEVPVGYPLPGVDVHVVDDAGELQPVYPGRRVEGELVIGGKTVGLGYLNEPTLTQERFMSLEDGSVGFLTRDMVRAGGGEPVLHMGRVARVESIHGTRVRLDDLETRIRSTGLVVDVVACVIADARRGPSLVALVVLKSGTGSVTRLRGSVREVVPDYLNPDLFIVVRMLPRLENGKVDFSGAEEVARAWLERSDNPDLSQDE